MNPFKFVQAPNRLLKRRKLSVRESIFQTLVSLETCIEKEPIYRRHDNTEKKGQPLGVFDKMILRNELFLAACPAQLYAKTGAAELAERTGEE